jgi:predicted PurR-regulated permease PerM
VDQLERRLPRALAVLLVYPALAFALGGLVWLAVSPLVEQARALVENAPSLIARGRRWVERWNALDTDHLLALGAERAGRLVAPLVALPLAVAATLAESLVVLTISAYWRLATPALARFALSLFPRRARRGGGHAAGDGPVAVWREGLGRRSRKLVHPG